MEKIFNTSTQHMPQASNLGVRFDPHLNFEVHRQNIAKTAFLSSEEMLQKHSHISPTQIQRDLFVLLSLTGVDNCTVMVSFVAYTKEDLDELQRSQNAAGVLTRISRRGQINFCSRFVFFCF